MHRCLIESVDWTCSTVPLPHAEAHHLVHVLRARPGAVVRVFDGRGREADAVLHLHADGTAVLQLSNDAPRVQTANDAPPGLRTTLIQALPKGRKMDLIVEKATELGVGRIVPAITRRVVSHPGDEHARVERWRRVARGAAKQCGTRWIPAIEEMLPYERALSVGAAAGLFLVGSLEPDARLLRDVLRSTAAATAAHDGGGIAEIAVLIGPEGDLTPEELQLARASGARPVSFGTLTLRAETAAIFAAAAIVYELH